MVTMAAASRRTQRDRTPPTLANGSPLLLHVPASAHTFAGFRAWIQSDEFPEKLRATFLDQEIYLDMSQEELGAHVLVKDEVSGVVRALNKRLRLGFYFGDGAQISHPEAGVSNQPDATLLTRASIRAGRVRLIPKKDKKDRFIEIEGTPDWVMEVVSDSSVKKDTALLRAAYHRAGIPEYWLIDARGEAIQFQIYHWRPSGYVKAPGKDGWQRSRVFGREFRLIRTPEEFDLWEYTLEMRPD